MIRAIAKPQATLSRRKEGCWSVLTVLSFGQPPESGRTPAPARNVQPELSKQHGRVLGSSRLQGVTARFKQPPRKKLRRLQICAAGPLRNNGPESPHNLARPQAKLAIADSINWQPTGLSSRRPAAKLWILMNEYTCSEGGEISPSSSHRVKTHLSKRQRCWT